MQLRSRKSGLRLFESPWERNEEDLAVESSEGVKALDSVSLTIPNGQTFVIVGPSGCGKSTLLRVVAGLERNYTGQVLYDGEDMQNIPASKRFHRHCLSELRPVSKLYR